MMPEKINGVYVFHGLKLFPNQKEYTKQTKMAYFSDLAIKDSEKYKEVKLSEYFEKCHILMSWGDILKIHSYFLLVLSFLLFNFWLIAASILSYEVSRRLYFKSEVNLRGVKVLEGLLNLSIKYENKKYREAKYKS